LNHPGSHTVSIGKIPFISGSDSLATDEVRVRPPILREICWLACLPDNAGAAGVADGRPAIGLGII